MSFGAANVHANVFSFERCLLQSIITLVLYVSVINAKNAPPLVCASNHTLCNASYSANGKGCCVFENAVCCPNQQTCCPQGSVCQDSGRYLTTCVSASQNVTGKSVCKFGPPEAFSPTLKNVVVIGDSVSIGYTPYVIKQLSGLAAVQHSPWGGDGGAEETNYGLQCLDYFLRSPYSTDLLVPDIVMFNFGLHDGPLGNSTTPGQQGNATVYPGELTQIAERLANFASASGGKVKLLYALTSPMLCKVKNDGCVQNLNNVAKSIMQKFKIPTLDIYSSIVGKCGIPPQQSCFNTSGCFCPHCPAGYSWLAQSTIVPAIKAML